MLGMLLLTVGLILAAGLIGQGILALCGAERWRWWSPALGYAVLLSLGAQVLRIPNHGTLLTLIAVVAALGSLALERVRRALAEAAPGAVLFGLLLLLIAAIPFFAIGHAGVLGASLSNDMSQHLTAAFYLRTGRGLQPVAALGDNLLRTGYPLGAHGLTTLLTRASGIGEERAFSAITLAIPVFTGFAALGLVPSARRGARWALGLVVGLGYLAAAYYAQGSFKETTQALLVLVTAVALHDLTHEQPPRGWRRGVPIGLLLAGAVYNYSYGGSFWLIGTAALLLAAEIARRPRAAKAILRQVLLPVLAAVLVAAIILAPEFTRIAAFTKSQFGVEPLTNQGNLFHAVNPLETIGVWFSGDFRFNPKPEWPSYAFSVLGVAALAGGLVWWWRRGALAVPAALITSIVIWAELALTRNIYNAAKGLAVMGPVAMACAGAPLIAAWSARSRSGRSRRLIIAVRIAGAALLVGALVSTFSVLRSTPVGLGSHEHELAKIRPLVRGKTVLFLTNDHFAQWELRGSRLFVTSRLYSAKPFPQVPQKIGSPTADVDDYESAALDGMDFIVQPGGAYRSEVPPNFRLVMRTDSYELYRRRGPTPARAPIDPPGQPGAVFNCSTPQGKDWLARFHWAGVVPAPVVSTDWQGSFGVPGHTAKLRVTLPRGRWDVSLQYVSFTSLKVRGPQLDKVIAPNYGLIFPYWPAGTLSSDGRPFTLSVTSAKRSWFGRLLGSPRGAISADTPNMSPAWHVAFTRSHERPRRVVARAACGRYVDWFAPAGSSMR